MSDIVRFNQKNKTLRTQTFTTSGTWTRPVGVNYVLIDACAGGASGDAAVTYGNGGGAGQYVRDMLLTVTADSYAVTVGAGGVAVSRASSDANKTGNAGGVTSFGSILSLTGGSASRGEPSDQVMTTNLCVGGKGQDCPVFGIGGSSSTSAKSADGYPGLGNGSGGGAANAKDSIYAGTSGAGAPGIVIVKWFE